MGNKTESTYFLHQWCYLEQAITRFKTLNGREFAVNICPIICLISLYKQ